MRKHATSHVWGAFIRARNEGDIMSEESPDDGGIDRRTYLAALSATAAAGLAGCGGGGSGDSGGDGSGDSSGDSGGGSEQDLGERVPTVSIGALGGVAGASNIEQANLHIRDQLESALGVPSEVAVKELTTYWSEVYNDARTFSFSVDLSPPFPSFLDPDNLIGPYHISYAGANGKPNTSNYANCEYSQKVEAQRAAANPEEREELVNEAAATASEEVTPITLVTNTVAGVYRTDQVNASGIGTAGVAARNPEFLWESEPIDGTDQLLVNMTPGNIPSVVYQNTRPATPWVGTVYMPLLYRDKDYELAAGAAESWDVEDGFQTFTFNLRDGMTFHNGDPITSEDVKWTLNWLNDNSDVLSSINSFPYESIETPDDTTVVVNMESPQPPYINAFIPNWSGVLPKDVWVDAGAEENPKDPDLEEIIGSGPYQVENYQPRQLLALSQYDDHWIDTKGGLTFRGYSDRQTARRAFEEGSLNVLINSTTDTNEQIKQSLGDTAEVVTGEAFTSWEVRSQHSFAPAMFTEFRHAVSQAINRQRMLSILNSGQGSTELYSSFIGKTHPWRPPEDMLRQIADSPQANPETAKQILRDEGWGWDDSGRLRYPADKDLTPRWPEDSTPCDNPEGFPCLPDLCE